MKKDFTFIIPTYNSEIYIHKCLRSISKQDYSRNKFEVFIIDGGSNDKTLSIVGKYKSKLPIKVLKNKNRDAESGKYLGLQQCKGEVIILLDSDNEIVKSNWLKQAKDIFDHHAEIWGLESPWLVNQKDTLINQYFAMMKMTDPVARLFRPWKEQVEDFEYYELVTIKAKDTPVTGANGFFWRNNLMKTKINESNKFEETNYVAYLVSRGNVTFARFKDNGIYHYYCNSFSGFIKKRIKIANKYLDRKQKNQKTWVDRVGYKKLLVSLLYNLSVIGPTFEAIYQIQKTKNIAWLYHPLTSFITVVVYGFYSLKRKYI